METKTCQQCGTQLRGRTDKKFCDDLCRTTFNNHRKTDTQQVRNINSMLRKNRKVLEALTPDTEGKVRTTKRKLQDKGFFFGYHTHTYTTRNGNTYYFCYEYGFLPIDNDHVVLIKRTEKE